MQDSSCKVLQGTKGIYKDKVERCLKCNRIHFRQRGYREYDLYRQNQDQKMLFNKYDAVTMAEKKNLLYRPSDIIVLVH